MEGRIYLKEPVNSKFIKKAKELDADYIEKDYMVFKSSDEDGSIAVRLKGDNTIGISYIDSNCDNFIEGDLENFTMEEARWLGNLLIKLTKNQPKAKAKKAKKKK